MSHLNRFQQLVADAKQHIHEIPPGEAESERKKPDTLVLDVRSAEEYAAGHVENARHLERGELELEIEEAAPDLDQPIICYCGGGSRSALAAGSLGKMGYRNVRSIAGGYRAWCDAGLPTAGE